MMDVFAQCRSLIDECDILLIATGAGMSKDSGLPVYKEVQNYTDSCSPKWLQSDDVEQKKRFLNFQFKALNSYRATKPHAGYEILKELSKGKGFVVTSNVDSAHRAAGFDSEDLFEIHGNLETWQCSKKCTLETWPLGDYDFGWDGKSIQNIPICKNCNAPARPSICLFDDLFWITPEDKIAAWKSETKKKMSKNKRLKLVILEIGCGDRVPTIRTHCEDMLGKSNFFACV